MAGNLDKIIELKDQGVDINVFTPVSCVCVYKIGKVSELQNHFAALLLLCTGVKKI